GFRSLHCRLRGLRRRMPVRTVRRRIYEVLRVQLGRGRGLNGLHRILHTLRLQRADDFLAHVVYRQSIFVSHLVHQVSVGRGQQLRRLAYLQVEDLALIGWQAGATHLAQPGRRLALESRRGDGLILQFGKVFSRGRPPPQRPRQLLHRVLRFLLLFLGGVLGRRVIG